MADKAAQNGVTPTYREKKDFHTQAAESKGKLQEITSKIKKKRSEIGEKMQQMFSCLHVFVTDAL